MRRVPHLGVYGEEFFVCLPHALLSMPWGDAAEAALPKDLVCALHDALPPHAPKPDLFLAVHPAAPRAPSAKLVSPYDDEVSIMLHGWALAEADFGAAPELVTEALVGVFAPHGVQAVWTDLKDGGVTFGKLAPRTVSTHGGALSPANCMLRPTHAEDAPICGFFSCTVLEPHVASLTDPPTYYALPPAFDHDPEAMARARAAGASGPRAAVTYHVLPENEAAADALAAAITADLKTPAELLAAIAPLLPESVLASVRAVVALA
jgi:hypothetical protein